MAKPSGLRNQPLFLAHELKRLKALWQANRSDLAWYYEIGKQVLRLVPADDREYGKARMGNLVRQLSGRKESKRDLYTEQVLYAARTFASHYSRQDLAKMDGLSWTHMKSLLSVKNSKTRATFLRKCLRRKNPWSVWQLGLAIREQQERISKGGRPPRKVEELGARAALQETIRLSQQWLRFCPEWFDGNKNQLAVIAKQEAADTLLLRAIAELRELEQSARQLRQNLQKLRR